MQLILVILGVIVAILGILNHFRIIPHMGYQLITVPGYATAVVGIAVALTGLFL